MTPKEFENEMKALKEEHEGDQEGQPGSMSNLMCEPLWKLGYKEGVEISRSV